MNGLKVKPLSRKVIQDMAHTVRKKCGWEKEPYFPIIQFVELVLPTLIPGFQFEVKSVEEMGEKHGETFPDQARIIIREDVYYGACDDIGRDRMTMAHELAHLLLHHDLEPSLCRFEPNAKMKPYEDSEWQADVFAGELLAPSYIIKGMSIQDISEKCCVSKRAANVQLMASHRR